MSETIYNRNLAAFAKRYDSHARYVDGLDTGPYQVRPAKEGNPILGIQTDQGQTVLIGDEVDPKSAVLKLLPEGHDRPVLFLVMGMGLGYLLFEAAKRFPKARFFVIEPEAHVFKKALQTFDFTPYFNDEKRFEFAVSFNLALLPRFFINHFSKNDNHVYLPTVQLLIDQSVTRYTHSYYDQAAKAFQQAVHIFWSKETGTDYQDSLLGLKNTLANIKNLQRFVALDAYRNFFKGKIGVVVSSGPSLDTKLDLLKKIQNQAIIICADSALKRLLSFGIKPFGVSAIERTDSIPLLFQGYDIPKDIVLFAPLLLKSDVFENFPGPIATFYRNCFPFPWLPPMLGSYDMGLNCASQAFQVLKMLGCREIALVGQDLAYDRKTGTSHYQGMYEYATDMTLGLQREMAEDNQGGMIETQFYWKIFRDMYQDMIAMSPEVKVVNVIEKDRGLKIAGAHRLDIKDFEQEFLHEPKVDKEFNFELGLSFIAKQDIGFRKQLACDIEMAKSQLRDGLIFIEKFSHVESILAYFHLRDEFLNGLSENVRYLYMELTKSDSRIFEANAFSQWSPEEFVKQRENFSVKIKNSIMDLLAILDAGGGP